MIRERRYAGSNEGWRPQLAVLVFILLLVLNHNDEGIEVNAVPVVDTLSNGRLQSPLKGLFDNKSVGTRFYFTKAARAQLDEMLSYYKLGGRKNADTQFSGRKADHSPWSRTIPGTWCRSF